MKLYHTTIGPVLHHNEAYYHLDADWDSLVNDDDLFARLSDVPRNGEGRKVPGMNGNEILPPMKSQELWASGVTYYRSKIGRQEEAKDSGGADFYARVYEAERPELFFKGTLARVVGHGAPVRIRKDSTWNVPEPELTLVLTSSGRIVGYTIGNDMSSRSIEGENPLYLPQAKTWDGSAALGPCVLVTDDPFPRDAVIRMAVLRGGGPVFSGDIAVGQIRRSFDELISFLYRECTFPRGCLLLTGTGIIPPADFSLQQHDEIRITIEPIGTLINTVA